MGEKSLAQAISAITHEIASPFARCIIADEGSPDESSLMGTRDGYLNLALVLFRFVADADAGRCELTENGYVWDDRIKDAMYQLPTVGAWIVSSCLFANHTEYMKELSRWIDPRLKYPLMNDPSFGESDVGSTECSGHYS